MRYINPLLFLLVLVIGIKLSDSAYKWVRYRPERAMVQRMRGDLVDAGAEITRTRQLSDSMRAVLRAEDAGLEAEQRALRRYDDYAHDGALPTGLYERYRAELARYNEHVAARNQKLGHWQDVQARNHAVVGRYNLLSDSIRDLAARMGDPYYAVPTPAEAAIERGIIKPVQ